MNTETLEVIKTPKKRNTKLDYKLKVHYNDDPNAPTFDEILQSAEFKKIMAHIITK